MHLLDSVPVEQDGDFAYKPARKVPIGVISSVAQL